MGNFRFVPHACLLFATGLLMTEFYSNGSIYVKRSVRKADETHRFLKFDPRTVTLKTKYEKNQSSQHGTIVAIINTPKCGTGGLTQTFANSFHCKVQTHHDQLPSVERFDCPEQKSVVRTHNVELGIQALLQIRADYPLANCLVVTSIRDPQSFTPSLFLQDNEEKLCEANIESKEHFILLYRKWIDDSADRIRSVVQMVRPQLLQEFGATSLMNEMQKMTTNGGYSLLTDPVRNGNEAFANCELLFLNMENVANWPGIISDLVPDVMLQKGRSRSEQCPSIAKNYSELKSYQLTPEERTKVIGGDAHVEEYFQAFGR